MGKVLWMNVFHHCRNPTIHRSCPTSVLPIEHQGNWPTNFISMWLITNSRRLPKDIRLLWYDYKKVTQNFAIVSHKLCHAWLSWKFTNVSWYRYKISQIGTYLHPYLKIYNERTMNDCLLKCWISTMKCWKWRYQTIAFLWRCDIPILPGSVILTAELCGCLLDLGFRT